MRWLRRFEYASLHGVLSKRDTAKPLLVIVLDHITDPHNLGAIIRTAECAGASAVVIPDRRAAGVNPTVRKTSAGAAEHIPIVRVGNLADAIRQLKKAHIWVAGADATEGAKVMTEADLAGDIALVIGAEGEGLAPLIRRECDFLVKIPLFGHVASLNASVAAAVLIYEIHRAEQKIVLDVRGDPSYTDTRCEALDWLRLAICPCQSKESVETTWQ